MPELPPPSVNSSRNLRRLFVRPVAACPFEYRCHYLSTAGDAARCDDLGVDKLVPALRIVADNNNNNNNNIPACPQPTLSNPWLSTTLAGLARQRLHFFLG